MSVEVLLVIECDRCGVRRQFPGKGRPADIGAARSELWSTARWTSVRIANRRAEDICGNCVDAGRVMEGVR